MTETIPEIHAAAFETDVAAFIRSHGTPYDPAADDYRRPLFAAPTKAGKNTTIYNAHSYHTKVPPQGIVPYIEHYTDPDGLVLDPFCGSGMTGVACRMTRRNGVLSDLSPAAVHIARNFCTPVDVTMLRFEFERLKAAVKPEFDWLYGTTCDRCQGPATIQYTIWSDVLECGRCGAELVLWDVAADHEKLEVLEKFVCPVCAAEWRKPQLRWLRSDPVVTNYECANCPSGRVTRPITAAEKQRIEEIQAAGVPYWFPTSPFLERDWEMWRGVHRDQGITDVSKFFRSQNLRAFASLWNEVSEVSDAQVREKLRFTLTGTMAQITKMTIFMLDGSGRGHRKGTLYVPSFGIEQNVMGVVERRLNRVIADWSERQFTGDAIVTASSATQLSHVPDSSIDYVFTDPPFGSNIFYADCNLIWEAWLNEGFTDQRYEAVVHLKHKDRNTLPDYARLMTDSFREMHRVLKPGRWASVVFHNSDNRIWQTILDAAESAGFELAEINAFDKEQCSFKGIRGQKGLERVTNQDIVLNLHKPGPNQARVANGKSEVEDTEARVVRRIADFLATKPPAEQRTLQYLWNQVLYELLTSGSVQVSMADVDAILPHYFKRVDGRWYLRAESVVGGRVLDIRSETDALTWLHAVLAEKPQTTGELIPQWQQVTFQATDAITKSLDELLRENFWQDSRNGKWRVPNASERDQMSAQHDVSDRARNRQIERYLRGDLDPRPTNVELCGWVQFAYDHKLYREAAQLFDTIHAADVDPELFRRASKLAQYCRMQAAKSVDSGQLPLL